jgi:hypothetical protein
LDQPSANQELVHRLGERRAAPRPPRQGSAAVRAVASLVMALLVGCGRSSPGARGTPAPAEGADSAAQTVAELADTLTGPRLAVALRAIGLRTAPGGQVVNDCDEAVTAASYPVDLGGSVGRAWLVVVGGGPKMLACYGNAELAFWLLRKEGDSFGTVLKGYGLLAVLTTEHDGVKDVAIGGPGFQFPVFVWQESTYQRQGWISDTLMPPPVVH